METNLLIFPANNSKSKIDGNYYYFFFENSFLFLYVQLSFEILENSNFSHTIMIFGQFQLSLDTSAMWTNLLISPAKNLKTEKECSDNNRIYQLVLTSLSQLRRAVV